MLTLNIAVDLVVDLKALPALTGFIHTPLVTNLY